MVNSVLGGSVILASVSEDPRESGLAYSIYSYPNSYTDCGLMTVYAAARPNSLEQVVDMTLKEVRALAQRA